MKRLKDKLVWGVAVATILWPHYALAALGGGGGALPWDPALITIQNDLQGPVAHSVTTAAIVGTGLSWGLSEHGTGVRKFSSVAFGGACALGATQLMGTLFTAGALW